LKRAAKEKDDSEHSKTNRYRAVYVVSELTCVGRHHRVDGQQLASFQRLNQESAFGTMPRPISLRFPITSSSISVKNHPNFQEETV
jgi:hypothetical protein